MQNPDRHLANKRSLHQALQEISEASEAELPARLSSVAAADGEWRMSHPLNEFSGRDQALEVAWQPLKRALPIMAV